MRIIDKEEFQLNKEKILREIELGAVFIHPTDTIYGLGCNALIPEAVKRIRKIKNRSEGPFSVIVPSKEWIINNTECSKADWLEKLPGPYTLICKLKNKSAVAEETIPNINSLGMRIPKHWFTKVSEKLNIPIVSTSANSVGGDFMTSLENLSPEIKSQVDFIIYEGEKSGKPSKVVDLTKEKVDILRP
ncbi:MAG: L-threonylcarbamoyladenylate synthase [Candidatus Woesearchaeota archaeon]|jgi:L-threonylcarbamoyladenylate synthase|nr:L-threonylcarbamoyladenylate synthase [Candidatus Woesearchaeota archaeon]MDP7610205.1 L-threonylcarbamoyladenylate synthase [Candidatus Woesearchaeota archaeon]|tara:strand:+ start:424 stop:990 length:567 start_codon:yes stop_codon:yes gene_type:complete